MKILQISPEAPSRQSGGGIGIIQTEESLLENGYTVDYMGPEIVDLRYQKYHRVFFLEPNNNVLLRAFDSLFLNTSKWYRAWKMCKNDYGAYDAVVMDFTKMQYILKKTRGQRLLVRVHNVEYDYSKGVFKKEKTLLNLLIMISAGLREKRIAERADRLITLTEKDKNRLVKLYKIPSEKVCVIPVCVSAPPSPARCPGKKAGMTLLITGSLWYGSNFEGIIWFLNQVYRKLKFKKRLIIAGKNPNPRLKRAVEEENTIILADSPDSMEPYFSEADLYLAPIFDGAGMKVKIAEAMSYGIPIVGTSHAFEGYRVRDGEDSFIRNTGEGFLEAIQLFAEYSEEKRSTMRENVKAVFQAENSMEFSAERFRQEIEKMLNGGAP